MKLRTISFNVPSLGKLKNYVCQSGFQGLLVKGVSVSLLGFLCFSFSGCNQQETDVMMYTRYENFRYVDDPTLSLPLEFRFYENTYVCEKNTPYGKVLVDAVDNNKILYKDYEKIGIPQGFKYYSSRYNGVDDDTKSGDGLVRQIILEDGTKRLVDADDLNNVLVEGYEQISEPFLLEAYSAYYGGNDDREPFSSGMVMEITMKDDKKYLVDANDFSKVILECYDSFEIRDDQLLVKYTDGSEKILYQKDLISHKLVLKQ